MQCAPAAFCTKLGWIIDSSYNDARYFTGQAVRADLHPYAFQLMRNLNIQILGWDCTLHIKCNTSTWAQGQWPAFMECTVSIDVSTFIRDSCGHPRFSYYCHINVIEYEDSLQLVYLVFQDSNVGQ